ncbi:LmeA family phospholipid-binding protein [Spirulina sp. CS-785/01]|uniref:LmeA family phospholipid-binding protein n=1 Tax=Spirulina sp. CS-785/01 TaxID=3021716 RepID=UPI003FA74E82
MFGGLVGSNQMQGTDWGERLLNSVATNTLRHLFTRSDVVEVEVSCNPSSKLLQGSIDSFKMHGKGLVIRQDFRTEEMSFETDAVSIDFSSVLKGNIALKQPTQALAQVQLSEDDINEAFKAELVRKRLEGLTDSRLTQLSGGDPVSFTDIELKLLPNNCISLFANAQLGNQTIPVSFSCALGLYKRRRITYKNPEFDPTRVPKKSQDLSRRLMNVLVEILNDMVDLDRFNLDGVMLRLNRLQTQGNMMLFTGYAQIERIPKKG